MPPRSRAPKAQPADQPEFYEWDEFVSEARVDLPPFKLRVKTKPAEGDEPEYEFIEIPCPSGAAYVNITSAQQRGDVAAVLVQLTTSTENEEDGYKLFDRLMDLLGGADFPVVDKLASSVIRHYFNTPKNADVGESSAS